MFWNKRQLDGLALYFTPTCSHCSRVRQKLWWWGLGVELKESGFNAENQEKLTREGGKFQVPCLHVQRADGESRWIYESDDILRFIKEEAARG